MTIEEAKKMAEAKLKCMERDVSGKDDDCNNHRCYECSLNYEQGNMGEQKEWLRMSIKALEIQEKSEKMKTMKCRRGYEIMPLKSAAGYYLGTVDGKGFPNCRISRSYAETKSGAYLLPMDRQVGCIENEHCNGGKGCFLFN